MLLPNVPRLSCGAKPAADEINGFLMACWAAWMAPPVGARGADSFKRLLGCGLSRWETSRTPTGPPALRGIEVPGRPARDDHPDPQPWIALVLSGPEVPAGRPTGVPRRGTEQIARSRWLAGAGSPLRPSSKPSLTARTEPGWTPLPNVLRLSCGANRRSG